MAAGLSSLARLEIGTAGSPLANAVVDVVGGPTGLTVGQAVSLPPGTQHVELLVARLNAGQPVTVPITVTDGCGPWSTFVGGGIGGS